MGLQLWRCGKHHGISVAVKRWLFDIVGRVTIDRVNGSSAEIVTETAADAKAD